MDINQKLIIQHLSSAPIFSECSNTDLARIVHHAKILEFETGKTIYEANTKTHKIYIVIEGSVDLLSNEKVIDTVRSGVIGEESLLGEVYLTQAVANGNTKVLSIPASNAEIILENVKVHDKILFSLLNHLSPIKTKLKKKLKSKKSEESSTIKNIGWILTIICPIIFYLFAAPYFQKWNVFIFITVSIATILMWVFRLMHEFIPSIFAVLVFLVLDIAPPSVALYGFTDGSFYTALSIFGLSAILVSSGLVTRLVILMLKVVPISERWHSYSLFFFGLLLTPLLPSANGRVALLAPFLKDLNETLEVKPQSTSATRLSVAAFSGFTAISTIFLSSKSIHFVVIGLLPEQVRNRFTWVYWFYASLAAGVLLIIAFSILLEVMFHKTSPANLDKKQIRIQYEMLGPLSLHEWAALGGIVFFLLGIVTSSLHKIQLPWIGLMVLYAILSLEFLSKKDFQTNIDWTFLMYLGTLVGIVKTMSYIGLDQIIGNQILWLGEYMKTDFPIFVLLLSIIIFVLRLFVPNNSAVAILASVLFPVAEVSGLNIWVVAFIILMMSDGWIFPYQCSYYIQFDELLGEDKIYNIKQFLIYNLVTNAFRLAAIYISIPYWRYIGLL